MVVLDRERIRTGARAGQPTAAFVLIVDDRTVWRGFNRDRAIEAAKQWTDLGAAFLDLTEGALT